MSELGSELGAFPDRVETPSAQDAWQKVLDAADAAARAWLRSSKPLTVHESTLMVAVPNEFTRERIESRQRVQIEEVLSDLFLSLIHI